MPKKFVHFKPARIVKGKRWYVEYYYRVPAELRPMYQSDFERFRVFEDINKYKGDNQIEYAEKLLSAVNDALENGYSPFEQNQIDFHMDGTGEKKFTIKEALVFFLEKYKKRGLSARSTYFYEKACEQIRSYFSERKLLDQDIDRVKRVHIENLLEELKDSNAWGNRQYNNTRAFIYTVFEFLRKKDIIPANPVEGVETLKTSAQKHRYFDKNLFPKVTEIIKENEPYLWYACQFVYYLAVRSEKELSGIRVSDIIEGGESFIFRKDINKSKRDDIVPVDPNLKEVFKEMGLFEASPTDHIFTIHGKPGARPFGKGFFSKKFAKIRKEAGLSRDYTLYGFKHTRVVHLVRDGAKMSDIMKLIRHTGIASTMKYLRDLGVDFDAADMMGRSRKI